jgi:hypothetical protein
LTAALKLVIADTFVCRIEGNCFGFAHCVKSANAPSNSAPSATVSRARLHHSVLLEMILKARNWNRGLFRFPSA